MKRKLIGIDVGASSGKMAFGEFDGEQLRITEYRNFANRPVDIGSALYWDVFAIYHAIIDGMAYFREKYGEADSVAIDTWGASYGLLDNRGRLLEPVYHYRDQRTLDTIEAMNEIIDPYDLFRLTGCQCNRTYTLPQLYSYITSGCAALEYAESMLLLPDLLGYFMTGVKTTEMTIAGTSCLMENQQVGWSEEVAGRFSVPSRMYTEIVDPGTCKGKLTNRIRVQTGHHKTKLVATVGHDSAAAVAAIPDFGEQQLYISVGTNISMGVEAWQCLLTRAAYDKGFKNTGGINRSKIVYRDFSACWHLNEFMRTKQAGGITYNHRQMMEMANDCTAEVPWFDVEDQTFNNAGGDFCVKMNDYFKRTGQRELNSDSEFIRSIYESIALKVNHYAKALFELGVSYKKINLVNGATQNELLMQLICNVLGEPVYAGMPHATLDGNLLTQLYAAGDVGSVNELRMLSGRSNRMKEYIPQDQAYWCMAVEKYKWF